ncbi:MAG: hypothetical protein KDA77_22700, partial [Planctomycetaceae bacterium]|nr:hypothetical protein [Planctomycetaceae bacterium]
MSQKSYNLGVLAGDGTGPEVIQEALKVLKKASEIYGFEYKLTDLPYGAKRYLKTNVVLTDEEMNGLRQFDAVLLGAIGHPDVKPGILEQGLLLKIRFGLEQYINLRPVKLYPNV